MRTVLLTLVAALVWAPHLRASAPRMAVGVGGFVHEMTQNRGSIRVRTRQWVYPIQVRMPLARGNVRVETALMHVQHDDADSSEVWGPLYTRLSGTWRVGGNGLLTLQTSLPTGGTARRKTGRSNSPPSTCAASSP